MKSFQTLMTKTILLTVAFLMLSISVTMIRAAGEVDPSFRAAVQDGTRSEVQKIVVQTNGKILVAGNFTVAGNSARTGIVRFNADGTVDQSFNPPDLVALSSLGYRIDAVTITAVAVQPDGKVLLIGNFIRVNNQSRINLIRLNADGSFDSAFAPAFGTNETVTDVKVQSNGQIVYSNNRQGLTRLNPDGSPDVSFQFNRQSRIDSFLIQADGKFIVSDSSAGIVYRVNADGSIDNSFAPATVVGVNSIALQPDGKILLGGSFRTVNGIGRGGVARLNTDGSLDQFFNQVGSGVNGTVRAIEVTSSGKVVIGGTFTTFNGTSRIKNARLNSDGTLDTSFNYNSGAYAIINAVAVTGDGGVILGGGLLGSDSFEKLYKVKSDGSLDASFVGTVYHVGVITQILRQPDGKVLIVGRFTKINGVSRTSLARLNADGSVDLGFNSRVIGAGTSIALQSNGGIVVGTALGDLFRFNEDGSTDANFPGIRDIPHGNAAIYGVVVQPDGKIVVAGYISTVNSKIAVMRFNTDGSEDTTFSRVVFNSDSDSSRVFVMKAQPDGKLMIGGSFIQINGVYQSNIARINTDGTLDTSFNLVFGVGAGPVRDVAFQSNGSIIVGGDFSSVNGTTRYYLTRIFPNGSLDTGFNPGPNAQVYAVAVQPDDKILIGGVFDAVGGTPRSKFTRINADGSLDPEFTGNANEVVNEIYLSVLGETYVGGNFNQINGVRSVGIASLLNVTASRRTAFDFDGDGRADVSVFRPSTGYWYTSTNPAINYGGVLFGQSGDKLVPADYDGDGRTDVAVVRGGNWYIQRSALGFTGTAFGDGNDIPVPADYDGDGKADIAVFRPSNGTWYLLQSTGGFTSIAFGLGTDKPVPGDYNGDGKAEVAVFRPSNGYWYLSPNPATNYGGVLFGQSEDRPVPADYDGDGKTDVAVFRPSNGTWYLLQSSAGFTGIAFGLGTDAPVPADYDGDGKADVAVFRNGNWYLNRTTQGFTGIQFGTSTDLPVPNSFVR